MVNAWLTEPVTLLRFDETLRQLLSGSPWVQILAAVREFFDAVACRRNSLRPRNIAPLSSQPRGFGRRRIRPDRAAILRVSVRDHRDRARVFCQPGTRDDYPGFRADDHDRAGTDRGLHPGAV